MKGRFFSKALISGIAVSALILASCSTTETRISGHPEIYQSLSPRDQALVSQGQIRDGMSPNAVYLAWGSPGPENCGQYARSPNRDLDLRALHDLFLSVSLSLLWARLWVRLWVRINQRWSRGKASSPPWSQLRVLWQPLLRSILLFLHTAKYSVSLQGRHFLQWKGCIFPVHGAAVSLIKNSVAFG